MTWCTESTVSLAETFQPSRQYGAALDHVFAIPVYGEPAFLDRCIQSILAQTIPSKILLGTSTPSANLDEIATQYDVEVAINRDRRDIATDWNFVLQRSPAERVTIAHQDDTYHREYLEVMTRVADAHPGFLMAFSDYDERTEREVSRDGINLKIKRALCRRAFRGHAAISTRAAKRRLLNLGNPVCCPSVMLNRAALPDFTFSPSYKTNLDWDAWLRLSEHPGAFLYAGRRLVSKRVHPASETSVTLANQIRQREDREIFERLWPKPVARLIGGLYALGYLSNHVAS